MVVSGRRKVGYILGGSSSKTSDAGKNQTAVYTPVRSSSRRSGRAMSLLEECVLVCFSSMGDKLR